MGYLRCEGCGAKALSAASTCPSCSAPFSLHDGRGTRVALKQCLGCGIMHRRDRTCHWCIAKPPSAWRSRNVIRSTTGIAAVALLAVGSWAVGDRAADTLSKVFAVASRVPLADDSPVSYSVEMLPAPLTSALPPIAITPHAPSDSVVLASADGALIVGDSILWVPAVARTWVNVRRDASRIGDVVGVIKPSERAMLGIGRSGWRQVRSPDVSGWVDGNLFEADSMRTRG